MTDETPRMRTRAENEALTAKQRLPLTQKAKGGSWYDGWVPYCGVCSTMIRMEAKSYGFKCVACQNEIGFDLTRLQESPLNSKESK